MVYLFAAYAVFWALTFVYLLTIASRQKRLQEELETLGRALEREER